MDISGGGWQSRIVGHGEASPGELTANPRNWRKHPKAQRDALAAVLDRVGWVQDVIVNRTTGHLVDGHARLDLARQRGEASVPVVYVELDADEEALVLATLDPLAAMAETDDAALRALIDGVTLDDPLRAMLDAVVKPEPVDGLTDPDEVPEPVEAPYVQRGEVYRLGAHRLMCGDSTDAGDVGRLLDGAKPALMVTDPPYGVEYEGGASNKTKRDRLSGDESAALYAPAIALSPSTIAYLWHAGTKAGEVYDALGAAGWTVRAQIIWNKLKAHYGAASADYKQRHEPCLYAVRAPSHFIGPSNEPTVWDIDQPSRNDLHPTQKPVECMERAIRNHAGDVYEPFAGSGTTIIAAERQSRRCYAMEIEPRYVQVAITRWEQFTGRKAEKVQDAT